MSSDTEYIYPQPEKEAAAGNQNEDVMGFGAAAEPDSDNGESQSDTDALAEAALSGGEPPEKKNDGGLQGDDSSLKKYENLSVSDESMDDSPKENNGEEESKSDEADGSETDDEPGDKLLNSTKAAVKGKPHENRAAWMNRKMIVLAAGFVLLLFVVFFNFFAPGLKTKKQDPKLLDKAGSTYIPDEVDRWQPPEKSDGTISSDIPPETARPDENVLKDVPGTIEYDKAHHTAPVQPQQQRSGEGYGGGASSRPETNRNEQQKEVQRMVFSDNTGSSSNPIAQAARGAVGGSGSGLRPYTINYPSSPSESLSAQYAAGMMGQSSYKAANDQSGKEQFAQNGTAGAGGYEFTSDTALWIGTDIPAVLDTAINTDNPGMVKAHTTSNIYSSKDGMYMIIPQGTVLIAHYNSNISYAQKRVQIAWETMVRPDGLEVRLGNMTGIDETGASGQPGFRNAHPFEYAKAMGLIAMFSIIETKFNNQIDTSGNQYAQNAMSDVYNSVAQINNKIIDKAIDVQPTITVPAGTVVHLITNTTMELPPADNFPVTQKYIRY